MSENKNFSNNRKKDLLSKEIEHIDITKFDSREIISSMEKMSFVSRETANAAIIFNEMLKDKDCTIFLTLAGSTSAAGCMHIYRDLVKYNKVDAIVATAAAIKIISGLPDCAESINVAIWVLSPNSARKIVLNDVINILKKVVESLVLEDSKFEFE